MLLPMPLEAVKYGIAGRVILKLAVGTEDHDAHAHESQVAVSKSEGVFNMTALNAVAEYVFQPAKKISQYSGE